MVEGVCLSLKPEEDRVQVLENETNRRISKESEGDWRDLKKKTMSFNSRTIDNGSKLSEISLDL